MITLAGLLDLHHIALDVAVGSKKRLLEELARLFKADGLEAQAVFQALFERERLGSTAIGHGVVVPHARLSALAAPRAALIRLKEGIMLDAPDQEPVRIALALLVPASDHEQHLALLAEIAERLSAEHVRQGLLDAATPKEALAALFLPV